MEGRKAAVSAWRTPRFTARGDVNPDGSQANLQGNYWLSKQCSPSGRKFRPFVDKPAGPPPLVSLRSSDIFTAVPPLASGSALPSPAITNHTSDSTSVAVPLVEIQSSDSSPPTGARSESLSEGKAYCSLSPKFLPSCARSRVDILQSSPPSEILSLSEAEVPPSHPTCRDVLSLSLSAQIDPVISEPSSHPNHHLSEGLLLGTTEGDSGVECALSCPAPVSFLKLLKPVKSKPSASKSKAQQSTNKRRKPPKASLRGSSEQLVDHTWTHFAAIASNSDPQSESRESLRTVKARTALSGPARKRHLYLEPPPRFSDMLVKPVKHNGCANVGVDIRDSSLALVVYSGPTTPPP